MVVKVHQGSPVGRRRGCEETGIQGVEEERSNREKRNSRIERCVLLLLKPVLHHM